MRVTVVQMPAVNTPQFSWVRSRLPRHPQPVPPIYQPEVAARGVLCAADHPSRSEYWVGASTARPSWPTGPCPRCSTGTWPAPGTTPSRRASGSPPGRPDNLWQPVDGAPGTTTGRTASSTKKAHPRSS